MRVGFICLVSVSAQLSIAMQDITPRTEGGTRQIIEFAAGAPSSTRYRTVRELLTQFLGYSTTHSLYESNGDLTLMEKILSYKIEIAAKVLSTQDAQVRVKNLPSSDMIPAFLAKVFGAFVYFCAARAREDESAAALNLFNEASKEASKSEKEEDVEKSYECIQHFLKETAQQQLNIIDVKDAREYTPLMWVANFMCDKPRAGNRKGLEKLSQLGMLLLEHRANIYQTTPTNRNTILHMSVIGGSYSFITMLIAKGADVNAYNHHNRTPLHIATCIGRPRIVELLRQHGALLIGDQEALNAILSNSLTKPSLKRMLKGAEILRGVGTPFYVKKKEEKGDEKKGA
jgi:hypothetical protein